MSLVVSKRVNLLNRDNASDYLGLFTLCWRMKISYIKSHYLWKTCGWCYPILIRLYTTQQTHFLFH